MTDVGINQPKNITDNIYITVEKIIWSPAEFESLQFQNYNVCNLIITVIDIIRQMH